MENTKETTVAQTTSVKAPTRMPMAELKTKDPAMYAVLKAKRDKKLKEKNENLRALVKLCAEKGDEAMKLLAAKLTPKPAGTGLPRVTFLTLLGDIFKAGNTVHEDIIFKNFKLGRTDMRKYIVMAIKQCKPEERMWVSFEASTGVYTLKGKGVATPAGWTGYIPVNVPAAK